ncbi:hypothetical protein Tco_0091480 [Tanacetum coccineum]
MKKEMIKEESKEEVKEESKEEESNRKRKLGTRKKIKSRKRRFIQNTSEDDSEKENMELDILTISPDLRKKNNGQKRYFSTLMRVLSIFDRDDLNAIYQLVMDKYQDEIPEGFDRVLWGDLMVMFNPDDEDKFWNSQPDWNILESEEDSTMALELIRFVKKLLAELEPEDSNGDEEDL